MSRALCVLACSFGCPAILGGQSSLPIRPIVPESASLELVTEVGALTEGPVVGVGGRLYFVELDIPSGGRIWQWDFSTKSANVVLAPSGLAAGLAIGPNGDLYTAEVARGGGRRIGRVVSESNATVTVADSYQSRPIHGANDLVFDNKGRLYFTEYALLGPRDVLYREGSGVYKVDSDGAVVRLVADAGKPNGIAISPDQRTLYVSSNRFDVLNRKAILAFDLSSDGEARLREVLVQYPPEQLPDGMTVDEDGNLYVAFFSGRTGVAIYSPDGVELDFIPTSAPATNVTFGRGAKDRTLYITAGTGMYQIEVNRRGYHPQFRP